MKKNLSQIMKDAWRMFRITGQEFAECLKKAWMLYKLVKMMKKGVAQFFYLKCTTGEIRQAFGTLSDTVLNEQIQGSNRRKNEDLLTYWDTEKNAFRAMKKFNLIRIA